MISDDISDKNSNPYNDFCGGIILQRKQAAACWQKEAVMAKKILAWSNVASQFYREIGKKENGKAVRFYLGADEKKAMNNVTRLEALWDGVVTRWKDLNSENLADTAFPSWDDATLSLGRAICKGDGCANQEKVVRAVSPRTSEDNESHHWDDRRVGLPFLGTQTRADR